MKEFKEIWNSIKASNVLTEEDTSVFYYSLPKLKKQLDNLSNCFGNKNRILHTVAIKTNPHPAILKFIAKLNYGLEAASYEEVLLARQAGVPAEKISYNSPVKTRREIDLCIKEHPGIFINVNSFEELKRIPKDADVQIGLRVNPCVDLQTNDLYNVSKKKSKFGIPITDELEILQAIAQSNISVLHLHVGSQLENSGEMVRALRLVYNLAEKANIQNPDKRKITTINIGGGLASGHYMEENYKNMSNYVEAIYKAIPDLIQKYKLITEFGQWTHRLNGICFSKIEYVKHFKDEAGIAYIHLGGDMFLREIYTDINDFTFEVVQKKNSQKKHFYDIAGPLCYNGDYIARKIELPQLQEGDIFVIQNTGANTFGLWSSHCSRTIPKFITEENNKINILSERYL